MSGFLGEFALLLYSTNKDPAVGSKIVFRAALRDARFLGALFPGLRFAPPGAILDGSLREHAARNHFMTWRLAESADQLASARPWRCHSGSQKRDLGHSEEGQHRTPPP